MTQSAFDAAGFARFDLASGTILSPQDKALTLMPVDIVASLAPTPGLRKAAADWGREQGKSLSGADDPGVRELAQHLQGSMAVMGMGRISVEIHGSALLFRVASPGTAITGALKAVLEGFLRGYLEALKEVEFDVITIAEADTGNLLFAGNSQATGKLQAWINDGSDPLAAVGRLNREGSAS